MIYIKDIIANHPIRRSEEQKEKFRKYICEETKNINKEIKVECLDKKHNNILIGNIDDADVVFTAHYDTPAASIFPNIMMPRNKVLGMIYQFSYPIGLALLSLGISYLITNLLGLSHEIWAALYIVLYLGGFYLLTRCFDNKNNYNDNTSGVASVLELAKKSQSNKVAFILFDNEEKGKLGSKAFSNYHKNYNSKLIINLDCVGNGNNIIIVAKDNAIKHRFYNSLKETLIGNDDYNVEFYGMKGSLSNSDYKNFECGISVMACKKKKIIGYYTPRIHTKFDVICDNNNIEFIVNSLLSFTHYVNTSE